MDFKDFLMAFIPICVAVDAIGLLPLFLTLTEGLPQAKIKKVIYESLMVAVLLAIGFILVGRVVFRILGITLGDFMIAGGIILFIIAVLDLITSDKKRRIPAESVGAVPIGTPLMVGPAVLATSLLSVEAHGFGVTITAVLANIFLAGLVFIFSGRVIQVLGISGAKALSKVLALLLATYAVMMVRKGLMGIGL